MEKGNLGGYLRPNWEEMCFPLLEVFELETGSEVLSISLFSEHFWVVASAKGFKGG